MSAVGKKNKEGWHCW